ncbi:MAG: galactose mutarotase [Bacteroidales bacterium]|nr:galactose mutarotase [Bacteroidales bacterium]
MSIAKEAFGKLEDGRKVDLYTLKNKNGIIMKITNYGGIITHWYVPDKNGKAEDIVLGYDSLDKYLRATPYFGAIVGRYANRIAEGKFTLKGKTYELAKNNGANHLHGGMQGFDKVLWTAESFETVDSVGLKLNYTSPDGEEGYPGNLDVEVIYALQDDNAFHVTYKATTDKATPINLSQHSYFNLSGVKRNVLDHKVMIKAGKYTVVNENLIPTGELRQVENTPMDFTAPHTIGSRIEQVPGGYDHNYVLNKPEAGNLSLAARVSEPKSGRIMEIYTTEPGLQFYAGNFLDGQFVGKGKTLYKDHWGFCMETQHFPDSPNQPDFPSTILRPGETYYHYTEFRFGIVNDDKNKL